MQKQIDLYSELLRELEVELATRDMNVATLKALIDAIKSLKVDDVKDFCKQFSELVRVFSQTQPKFGILNYHFAVLHNAIKEFKRNKTFDASDDKWKRIIIKKIKDLIKEAKIQSKLLIKYSEKINVQGKTILIHDHSHTVQDALVHYKSMGKNFRVVITEQDFEKTHSNIERMHKSGIPFQVVPSYMLSHVHGNIDMVFFGAVTLKDTMDFVMAPGSHGIVSEFHMAGVPIYVFMNTLKFSLWESKQRSGVFVHKDIKTHYNKPIEYERIKYSHDRIPAKLFTGIVTNEGVLTPEQVENSFKEKCVEYRKMIGKPPKY